jgi:urease accessory protein
MRTSLMNTVGISAAVILPSLAIAGPAFAHHAMGGRTPRTLIEGLISGFAHPVIGVDHLAFVIGVGMATALLRLRLLTLSIFIGATVLGCILQLEGIILPLEEIFIAASVLIIGVIIMARINVPGAAYVALFGIAGLFHGWGYGESIIGAEQTPVFAYLAGFAAIQFGLALAAMTLTEIVWETTSALPLRLAGGIIAGIGGAFLIENLEKLAFPGIV